MATYFISDTHFDSEGIIRFEGRPFPTIHNMNQAIMDMWNYTVKDDDEVWHLGDFIWNDKEWDNDYKEHISGILKKLKGKKNLVMGNHDTALNVKEWMELGFDRVYDIPVLYKGFYILSHEPIYVTESSPYANIYGHVHGNPNYKNYSSNGFCVCVERTAYTPVSFDDIKSKILSANNRDDVIIPN